MTKKSQLDRDIDASLSHPLGTSDKQPLYGHTSEATSYLVADYPYGFTTRTSIRYWLEHKAGKGWRFVSQTLNPKTARWNKPKASTYSDWGAAMYLDDKGHVQWSSIGPYTDEQKILSFVESFPGADLRELRKVVPAKLRYLQRILSGEIVWTINGVKQPRSEADEARTRAEIAVWEQIAALVGGP